MKKHRSFFLILFTAIAVSFFAPHQPAAKAQSADITNDNRGVQIGKSATQKVGFHGASPVIMRSGSAQALISGTLTPISSGTTVLTGTDYNLSVTKTNALIALVNELRAALVQKGIIKGGP